MAVQFASTFDNSPLALALALQQRNANSDSVSSDMEKEMQKFFIQHLGQNVGDTSPIQSPWQGVARVVNGGLTGLIAKKAMDSANAQEAQTGKMLSGLPGLSSQPAAPMPSPVMPDAAPAPAPTPGPTSSIDGPPPPQMASIDPQAMALASALAGKQPGPQLLSANPPGSNEIVTQARSAIDAIPMPRSNPMAQPQMANTPVMASDGMAAPRPPANIPNALAPQYVDQIKKFEGFTPRAAFDYKQYSNGYGTRASRPGEVIDQATAEQRLAQELAKASSVVNSFAPNAPEGVKAALTSLTYNAGPSWTKSGLGQAVQAGDYDAARQRFLQYNKAGGRPLPGLVDRRNAEAQWFNQMAQNDGPVPLPRPRPQIPGEQPQPEPEMSSNAVRVASLGGAPTSEAPYPQRQPQAQGQTQLAQAGGSPQGQPARTSVQIPPDVAVQIKALLANPKTRAYGMQIYQQYAKPFTPEYQKLNDDTLYEKNTGKTMQVTPGYHPLVKPEERAQYGIPADDPRPYQVGPGNKLVNPPPESRVNIDQRAPSEFEKEYGQGMGKRALATLESGDKSAGELQNIQLLRQLNAGLQTGKLTPGIATMGAYLQSMGVDPARVGIDPNLPARAESMSAFSNKQLMGLLGPGGFPSQNFSDTDRKFLEKIVTSPSDRPETNEMKLSVAERIHRLAVEKANAWADARESGTSFEKFDRDWRRQLQSRDIFGDLPLPTVVGQPGQPQGSPQGPQAATPQVQEGMTATNPQTGQKIQFKGGQWVPMQ